VIAEGIEADNSDVEVRSMPSALAGAGQTVDVEDQSQP
jgi:hypothetical protein